MPQKICIAFFLALIGIFAWPKAEARIFESFAGIAEEAIPGVVNIRTKTYVRRDPNVDLYQFFLDGHMPNQGAITDPSGTGVIVQSDGHIVTNYHVIKDASKIEVLFANKYKTEATVVGIDRKTDLALLKASSKYPITPLTLGDSGSLRVGDVVLAIGNPFGFSHSVTSGIISAKGRVIGAGPYDDFLQTDAMINPGNSGGPLLDVRGRVIGINTAINKKGIGIGFAIPINIVKTIVADLKAFGKVRRPWLGVVGKNVLSTEDIEHTSDPSGVYGVILSNLIIDGPAHKAGLQIGDLVMEFDGQKVFDLNNFQRLLLTKKPADRARIKIYRRAKGFLNLTLDLEEVPRSQDLPEDSDLF